MNFYYVCRMNIKSNTLKAVLFAVLIFVSQGLLAQGGTGRSKSNNGPKVSLAFNPQLNKNYKFKYSITMDVMFKMKIQMFMLMTATDTTNGIYTVSMKIERMRMDIDAMGKNETVDTDSMPGDEKDKRGYEELKGIIGKTIVQKFDRQGKPIGKADFSSLGENARMKQFESAFDGFSSQLPLTTVGVGDSWKYEMNKNDQSLKYTYTVKNITDSEVICSMSGLGTLTYGEQSIPLTTEGDAIFSRANGLLIRSTGVLGMKMGEATMNSNYEGGITE